VPVSFLPFLTWLVILVCVTGSAFWSRKAFAWSVLASAGFVVLVVVTVHLPGWLLRSAAVDGDPESQYEYARWVENRSEKMNSILVWPDAPDVLGGYQWLERAARQDYPPAVFTVGVRLKYGMHVRRPAGWSGPSGNIFRQPELGQRYIDRARELGFTRYADDSSFY
jgi:hypothetical protein